MKQVQDPIYGYIDIDDIYVKLIDSAEFQRLRNIRQTGYASLYPSALHNRFVHSLGVFHLGKIAFRSLRENVEAGKRLNATENLSDSEWKYYQLTFETACLLHDAGHSPFSHTGETFYEKSTDFVEEIFKLVNSEELKADMMEQGWGKPHEAMSVIVGLKLLDKVGFAQKIDREFLARCIMGILYHQEHERSLILNTIIEMLNGKIIDVDKIDYLRRDAYVTGYSSIALDYERILSGYTISEYYNKKERKKVKVAAFTKKSLSVIENIAQANDMERRWIQSNPVILYDCRLIEWAIIKHNDYMMRTYENAKKYNNIFHPFALSSEGFPEEDHIHLRLLSDDDILVYLKNSGDPEIEEVRRQYFDRNHRYKPLWKNEAEFDEFVVKRISQETLESFFENIRDSSNYPEDIFFLNQIEYRNRKEKADKEKNAALKKACDILELVDRFAKAEKVDFTFALIKGIAFESNYQKFDYAPVYVELDEGEAVRLDDTLAVRASVPKNNHDNLFYVYTTAENMQKAGGRKKLRDRLIDFINRNWENQN